jgi:hypothetical protein
MVRVLEDPTQGQQVLVIDSGQAPPSTGASVANSTCSFERRVS